MEILVFIPPVLIGTAIVVIVLPQFCLKGVRALLTVCLGSGIGMGITSTFIFLWLAWVGRPGAAYHLFEGCITVILVAIAYYRHRHLRASNKDEVTLSVGTNEVHVKWLKRLFVILLLISMGSFGLKAFVLDPYGTVDTRIVWNYRARWLFRGGEQWEQAFFSPVARDAEYEDDQGHAADYPLLITASVYRGWEVIGIDHYSIPIMIAGLFTFATYLLLYASLALLRNRNQGYLAVLLMLVSTQFLHLGTDQYGDVPLAFFILGTVVLFSLKDRFMPVSNQMLILAGFTTACAAWTKNEGLLFLLLVIMVRFVSRIAKNDRSTLATEFGAFLSGLLPLGATLLYFKTMFAPRNDMINIPTLKKTLLHLLNVDRYLITLTAILEKIISFNDYIIILLAVYLLFSGFDRSVNIKKQAASHIILLVLMLCGYLFAYVITPYDLEWHIGSSMKRLFIQLWPTWIFIFFYCVKGPELSSEENQIGRSRPEATVG